MCIDTCKRFSISSLPAIWCAIATRSPDGQRVIRSFFQSACRRSVAGCRVWAAPDERGIVRGLLPGQAAEPALGSAPGRFRHGGTSAVCTEASAPVQRAAPWSNASSSRNAARYGRPSAAPVQRCLREDTGQAPCGHVFTRCRKGCVASETPPGLPWCSANEGIATVWEKDVQHCDANLRSLLHAFSGLLCALWDLSAYRLV
jgi:hypothetical protein